MMSVRSEYDVAELRKQIATKRENRITKAHEKYAFDSDLTTRRDEWRAETEASVRALARRIKTVSDVELRNFRILAPPSTDSYSTPEKERDRTIREAHASFDRAVRRLDALRSTNGVLSLTPSMLSDLFGL